MNCDTFTEALRARGLRVRGSSAQCPAHEDGRESLSISTGRDAELLVYCHAGCDFRSILAAVGGNTVARPATGPATSSRSRIVAAYIYCNAKGNPIARKVRLEPKGFYWERANGAGWRKANSGEGNPEVLYHLPEISSAAHVHVGEGEKAADALAERRHTATCAPTGKWTSMLVEPLRDKEITIWIDRDEPGRKKARQAYDAITPVAASVRLVLPKVDAPHADAHDHLAAGFDVAEAIVVERAEIADVDARIDELAQLSPIEFEQCREKEAKILGFRVGFLDAEVAKRRPKGQDSTTGQGSAIIFPNLEPWPEPVDASSWLNCVRREFQRYIALPKHAAETIALWSLHTHALEAFTISPRLALTSPEKRCAKTLTLDVTSHLVFRPLPAANITSAALFRGIEKWSPTLLIDEADTFLRDSNELRGVLNSGHHRATAHVIRTTGEDHEPRSFGTWGAVAIALIGSLPGTLEDRSITIPMRRRRPDEPVDRFRLAAGVELLDFARSAARWARDHLDDLRNADPELPNGLHDRARDNWRPLIAIADLAGGDWPRLAREAAVALTPIEDASRGVQLLEDLSAIFTERGEIERLPSGDLVTALLALESRPWVECQRGGRPLTALGLARRLREFRIAPAKWWTAAGAVRGYNLKDLREAFERYLPKDPPNPLAMSPESNSDADLRDSPVAMDQTRMATGNPANSSESLSSGDMATGNREPGREDPRNKDAINAPGGAGGPR